MTERQGNVVFLEGQDDEVCEACGKTDECRPYGKRLESGRRLRICYDCAMKDEPETEEAFKELFDGDQQKQHR